MSKGVLVRRLAAGFVIAIAAIAASLPAAANAQIISSPRDPWVSQDIGGPTLAGESVISNGQFTISAGGAIMSDATDQLRFVYQILSGDVKISARVDSLAPAQMWSHAGLMIRSSLQPDAAHVSVVVTGDGGPALRYRRQTGGLATGVATLATAGASRWLGLERVGSRVTTYSSPDGKTWTAIGSESIDLGADVYVGIAAAGYDAGQTTVAGLSQVSVGGLPQGMRHRDIGAPAAAGTAWHSGGTSTVTSGGPTAAGTGDQFHLVYRRIEGDADVVARVASLSDGGRRAKAGVMIRESLTADSRQASVLVSSEGYAFDWRADTSGLTEHTDGGPGGIPGWVRLVRRGTNVEVFRSADGREWTSIGSTQFAAGPQVYVGLAVIGAGTGTAPAEANAEATATLDSVSITSTSGTSAPSPAGLPDLITLPPVVALTSPANGATFTAPATITLSALATDPELRMARVEFYADSTLLGSDTSAPYSFTWSSAPAGSYTLTAVALDADGGRATSAGASITVQPGPNQPPTATLTSPANGATFTAPATITLNASASDPENRLARVEFYRGSTLLGSDTSSPYSFTWASAPAGSYTLTAVATDADGGTTTSSAVSITVEANGPPTVTLTSPANGATFTAPATITLTASASDPENRLARVEFYQGSALLGSDTSAPYSFVWSSVPAGSYSLTAVAFDADGGQTTSSTVTILVNTAPPPPPRLVVFTASTDHDDNVTSYLLEVFANGADPETASAVASSDLAKPTPDSNRDITVDRASFFSALAPGTYSATVTAIGPDGRTRGTPVAFAR